MKEIVSIAAMSRDRGIGLNNGLPWPQNAEDMKHFRTMTAGQIVLMGRNTWESLPEKFRPLPGRINWILTSKKIDVPDIVTFKSIKGAIDAYNSISSDQKALYIIGGAQVYAAAMEFINRLEITIIPGEFEVDTYMPSLPDGFMLTEARDGETVHFLTWKRVVKPL
jgi:dihydrofolate reductase